MRTVFLTAGFLVLLLDSAAIGDTKIPIPIPAPHKFLPVNSVSAPSFARETHIAAQPPRPSAPIPLSPSLVPSQIPATPTLPTRPGETTLFNAEQRALIDRASTYLSGIQTLVGDFVQIGPDGQRTEGEFYIQKPGKVRFEYNPPSPIEIIADGQMVVVRDRKLATQDPYPLSQTPLRFLLADNINLLRDTNLVSVSADNVFVTVVLEEKQVFVGTSRLALMFGAKDFQLRQWTVTDPQGYDTTVAVYNLDTTKKPDPSMFKINYERVLQ